MIAFSRPSVAISCMPTQMPRNGTPLPITRSSSTSTMPVTAIEPGAAIGEGADAGQHDAIGRAHHLGVGGDDDRRRRRRASRAARSNALAAERRLPEP